MRTMKAARVSRALDAVTHKSAQQFTSRPLDALAMTALMSVRPVIKEIAGIQTTIIHGADIPYRVKPSSFAGVYAWVENIHQTNRLLYIGMSGHVLQRLRQHYWKPSPVAEYINELLNSQFRACIRYTTDCNSTGCDCLPRYFVEVVELKRNYNDIWHIEFELIKKYNPPLNKAGTVRDDLIQWPNSHDDGMSD